MADKPPRPLTPRDLCRIVFRHKWAAAFVFCATVAAVLALIVLAPRTYLSEAKLYVRLGRENVSLDPTATTGQWLPAQPQEASQIMSMLEVLNSRTIVERVVEKVGAAKVLGKSGKGGPKPNPLKRFAALLFDSALGWIRELDPVSESEEAIRQLMKKVHAFAPEGANVVVVECTAKSPGLAQEVVQTLVDIYMEEHVRINRTPGSHAFFVEQTTLLSGQLEKARTQLRELKNEMGILSPESQAAILEAQVMGVKTDLIRLEADEAASKAQIAALSQTIAELPETIVVSEVEGMPNVAADNMQPLLYGLQIQEAEYAARFVDGYAPLEALRKQVDLANDVLGRQAEHRVQRTNAINPVYQELQRSLLTERARLDSLRANAGSVHSKDAHLQEAVKLLNTRESQLTQLKQEVALLEANYLTYSTKLEESRINEALQNERISNVNVAEPATFVGRPISPRKGTVLMLGLVFAVAGAFLVIALAEFLDRTLQTPADVERTLDLPVLLSVPRSSHARVLLNC